MVIVPAFLHFALRHVASAAVLAWALATVVATQPTTGYPIGVFDVAASTELFAMVRLNAKPLIQVIAHTVTAGEATANAGTIATGFTTILAYTLQVRRAGVVLYLLGNPTVSVTGGVITFGDTGSGYDTTENDIVTAVVSGVF